MKPINLKKYEKMLILPQYLSNILSPPFSHFQLLQRGQTVSYASRVVAGMVKIDKEKCWQGKQGDCNRAIGRVTKGLRSQGPEAEVTD